MTSVDSQAPSLPDQLRDAYMALENVSPHNRLLSLAKPLIDGRFQFSEEYRERFVDSRDEFGTFGQDRYRKALEDALEERKERAALGRFSD